jgi:hypothetical protein
MGAIFSANNTNIGERVERALEIRQLKEEIESLKQDNNELRREMMRELNKGLRLRVRGGPGDGDDGDGKRAPSEVSVLEVDNFVDKLLADPATNLGMVPDFIERPAQRTTLLFVLKAIAHAIDTSSVELLGHEIIMRMQPIREKCDELEEGEADEDLPQYDSYSDEDYDELSEPKEGDVDARSIPM